MSVSYIMKPNGTVSMFIDGKMKSVETSHPNYQLIFDKVHNEDFDGILELIDMITVVQEGIKASGANGFSIEGNYVVYNGITLNEFMSQRLIDMMERGMNLNPIGKFLDNLYDNPSYRAVNNLYEFLEHGGIPITPSGNFLAYKKVRGDYKDIHSGTFDNSVGAVCKMHRFQVDEDPERTCSAGLHVCSFDYLQHFGNSEWNRVVICEINPKDVVAIPKDYNNTKMRVCEYKVVGELDEKEVDALRDKYCVSEYEDYDDCDDDDDDRDYY